MQPKQHGVVVVYVNRVALAMQDFAVVQHEQEYWLQLSPECTITQCVAQEDLDRMWQLCDQEPPPDACAMLFFFLSAVLDARSHREVKSGRAGGTADLKRERDEGQKEKTKSAKHRPHVTRRGIHFAGKGVKGGRWCRQGLWRLGLCPSCLFWLRAALPVTLCARGSQGRLGAKVLPHLVAAAALRIREKGHRSTRAPGNNSPGSQGLYLLAMAGPAWARVQWIVYLCDPGIGWHTKNLPLAAKSW